MTAELLAGLLLALAPAAGARAADGEAPTYHLRVDGLACPLCAYGIEKRLVSIARVARLDVDLAAREVVMWMAEGVVLEEAVARRAVEAAGFTLRNFWLEGAAE